MAKIQDIDIPHLEFAEAAAPATPASGVVRIYAKTDGQLYQKDDAGAETALANAAGGSVATDAIFDAAGDLVVGTGADTAARLAIGANTHVLTSNGTTAGWAAPSGGGGSTAFSGTPMGTLSHSYTFDTTVEDWTTTAGTLSSTGARLRLTHTSAAVGLEPSGATTVDDGEIDCLFNTTAISGSASVLFRAADTSNYLMVTYQTSTTVSVFKCVAGGFTQIQATSEVLPAFVRSVIPQHRLTIRYVGSFIQVYLNGTLVMAFIDASITAAGYVGVRVDNATLEIDTIGVYDL